MFIDTVIHHFFYQYINSIIRTAAITQFTDIHTRPEADMFAPVETPDGIFCIFK